MGKTPAEVQTCKCLQHVAACHLHSSLELVITVVYT